MKLARLSTLKKVQLLFKMYLEQMLKLVEDTLHDFLGRMKQMFTIGKKKGGGGDEITAGMLRVVVFHFKSPADTPV